VKFILWKEIARAHRKGRLPGRTNQVEWWINNEIVAYGRKPDDLDMAAFQGIHARRVLVVVDEACGVAPAIWNGAETLITNDESHILAIGNPDDPATYFAQICKPGSGWHPIRVSAFDSPNFTGEAIPEALKSLLIGPTWVEEKRKSWGEASPLYQSKVLGEFPEVGDDTLIPPGWIIAAVERELERGLPVELGCDIARFGADETVIIARWRGDGNFVIRHLAYATHGHRRGDQPRMNVWSDARGHIGRRIVVWPAFGLGGRERQIVVVSHRLQQHLARHRAAGLGRQDRRLALFGNQASLPTGT
jgi:hypothetical protein